MGVLLGGQTLGLVYAIGNASRTKLAPTPRASESSPTMTLAPAPLVGGAGLTLSITNW